MAAASRSALAKELVTLRAKHAAVYAREKELKSLLLADAGAAGASFKETIAGLGVVKVSAPKEASTKGQAPEVDVEVYLGLSARQQEKLVEQGIVRIVTQTTGRYYGSVTVELF